MKDRHTRLEWAEVIAHVVENMYPAILKLTLGQDHLSAQKKSTRYELFAPERSRAILDKIEWGCRPTYGSWLNIAECELSVLTRQALKERTPTKDARGDQVIAWYETRNDKTVTVDWQFTTKDARSP